MIGRSLAVAAALAGAVLILLFVPAAEPEPPGKDVFGLTRVWAVHLDIPTREYQALQPAGGLGFPGAPPAPPAPPGGAARPSERNLFGLAFPWVQGDLTA